MARYLARRLLLALVTLWLLVTIVFTISNVLPARRRSDDPRAVRPAGERRRPQRTARDQPAAADPLRRVRSRASSPSTSVNRSCPASRSCRRSSAAAGRSAKLAGLALLITIPTAIAAGLYAARRRDRKVDRAIVLLGVTSSSIPEFITGDDPGRRRRRPARLAAGPRDATAGRGHPDPDPLPADAGDRDGHRLLRLHRADDAGRHHRCPAVRLHANGDDEGADDEPDDAPPRDPQCARARPWPSSPSRSATCSAGSSRSRRSSTTTGWAPRCCSRPSARTCRC